MEKQKVIIIGDANVDLVLQMPKPNDIEDIVKSISEPKLYGGGSAANVAVAISKLGYPVIFCGTIGDDGYGKFVREDLIKEGVETKLLHTLKNSFTPMVIAIIQPSGERIIVVWPPERDADLKLEMKHIDKEAITKAGWLHVSGMCLRDSPIRETILKSMRIAKESGVPVSFDLNLRLELWGWENNIKSTVKKAIRLSDYIFGNADEEIIPISEKKSLKEAIVALSKDDKIVIARRGSKGSIAIINGHIIKTNSYPTKVLDTLGAGDSFSGGFIASKMNGDTTEEALQWGNAVAALKIQKSGARGVPSKEEVEKLISL
jgi:sugar/nucleoside kinase (ribokinase family)